MSTSASDGMTEPGPAIHSTPGRLTLCRMALATPTVGSKMSSQTMAMATGVAIIGSKKMALTRFLPRNVRLSSTAMPTPSTPSATTAMAVK